jgi:hypothetical protein
MNKQLVRLDRIPQSTQTGQLIPIQSTTGLYDPSSWLKNGDSPAEIILATAILVGSIAGLLNVFTSSKRR